MLLQSHANSILNGSFTKDPVYHIYPKVIAAPCPQISSLKLEHSCHMCLFHTTRGSLFQWMVGERGVSNFSFPSRFSSSTWAIKVEHRPLGWDKASGTKMRLSADIPTHKAEETPASPHAQPAKCQANRSKQLFSPLSKNNPEYARRGRKTA